MPKRRNYAIFPDFTDRESYLYSEDNLNGFCCSGGGNPMVVKVGGYYFYTDCDWSLKCHMSQNIADPTAWSPALVLAENLMEGTIVRVAKTFCPFHQIWRWVVVYNCYRDGHQDLAIEYT